jgi:hypothetical protein
MAEYLRIPWTELASLALLNAAFQGEKRGRAVGIWTLVEAPAILGAAAYLLTQRNRPSNRA